ncbi:MAG: GTP-binding protein [Oscillospiraceae bacterium]
MKKNVVIGILAHVDAGKTTLSEAMLYLSGKIKKLGRVDHRDSYLDTHSIERSRGITIFSKQAVIDLPQSSVTLLDTPGHVDFVSETERSLRVLDYAVLVISGTDGVQAHTETLWQLLRRYGIPTFIFVTKMDLPVCDRAALMADLQRRPTRSVWTSGKMPPRSMSGSPCAARPRWTNI